MGKWRTLTGVNLMDETRYEKGEIITLADDSLDEQGLLAVGALGDPDAPWPPAPPPPPQAEFISEFEIDGEPLENQPTAVEVELAGSVDDTADDDDDEEEEEEEEGVDEEEDDDA